MALALLLVVLFSFRARVSFGVADASVVECGLLGRAVAASPTLSRSAVCCGCPGDWDGLFFWLASQAGRSIVTLRRSVRALCTYCSVTYGGKGARAGGGGGG